MANEEHVAILKKGVTTWNAWRLENHNIRPDLSGAELFGADLIMANLSEANLDYAHLRDATLSEANLKGAALIGTDFSGADLTGCHIFGVSAWRLKLEGAKQQNLVITLANEPTITVDNIEVAQFIYLLLHNEKRSSTPSGRRACSYWAALRKAGWWSWSA